MLNAADDAFAEVLGRAGIRVVPAQQAYLGEPRSLFNGTSRHVALPTGTEDVSRIVRICAGARVGIVPFGGGTGLVAGQVATEGPAPLVLSLERMTAIREVFAAEDTLVAEAGATIAEIQIAADEAGRLFPLSYASQGTARLGGALSVNSGGLNVLRYGMARDLCLGIEAVLPDGSVLHALKRLRKDNTGYDLRHLLIGSEGTLGVITAAALRLLPRPAEIATAFLAVASPQAALSLLAICREQAGELVSAFELIPAESFAFLAETQPDLRQPFEEAPAWSVLTELGMGPGTDPESRLGTIFERAAEAGLVLDGRIAQGERQRADFWALREAIPHANRRIGAIASHDISLPLSEIPAFIEACGARIRQILPCRISAFGHLGDGNLHYNVFPRAGEARDAYMDRSPDVTRVVHDMVAACGGSFSAEHGVGRAKSRELERYGDPAKLAAMRSIKSALDPLGIMNPGAVFA
ncbi:MAG: FAD-binding oxidoreductase [Boseongicola sp. SB0677_bin_26]|nr:FAD-binding oxidoreductase [Boseongicola sp. SB0665_bin_10]MYG27493.1 FAD-binding oxidoreductase [Boseongicola sp. SB0677_bin_26]